LRPPAVSSSGDGFADGNDALLVHSLAAACAAFLAACAQKSKGVYEALARLARGCATWIERPDARNLRASLLGILTLLELKWRFSSPEDWLDDVHVEAALQLTARRNSRCATR
jgi:hypothetical protein